MIFLNSAKGKVRICFEPTHQIWNRKHEGVKWFLSCVTNYMQQSPSCKTNRYPAS